MKRALLLLLAFAGASGLPGVSNADQVKDPPPPIFVGPTPAIPQPAEPGSIWVPMAAAPATGAGRRNAADLEKLVAPIALHPDPLIVSILTAAAYPLEVVQAARFVANTNNLAQLDAQPWDSNVKTVAKFPAVIQKMNEDLAWTTQLGQAFVEQPMDVMNSIQGLRAKAQQAGTLKTTPQQIVTTTNAVVERTFEGQIVHVTNTVIQVQPASQSVIYVPSYNPATVYVDDGAVATAAFVSFGVGIAFGAAFWGHCDWYYGGCYWGGCHPLPPACRPAYYGSSAGSSPDVNVLKSTGRLPNEVAGARVSATKSPSAIRPAAVQAAGAGVAPASATSASAAPAQRWQPDQNRLSASRPTAVTRDARGSSFSQVQPASAAPSKWAYASVKSAAQPATVTGPRSVGSVQPSASVASVRPAATPAAVRSAATSVRSAPMPTSTPSVARSSYGSSWQQPSVSRPMSASSSSVKSAPAFSSPSSQSSSAFRGFSSGGGGGGSAARSFSGRSVSGWGGGGGSRGGFKAGR